MLLSVTTICVFPHMPLRSLCFDPQIYSGLQMTTGYNTPTFLPGFILRLLLFSFSDCSFPSVNCSGVNGGRSLLLNKPHSFSLLVFIHMLPLSPGQQLSQLTSLLSLRVLLMSLARLSPSILQLLALKKQNNKLCRLSTLVGTCTQPLNVVETSIPVSLFFYFSRQGLK